MAAMPPEPLLPPASTDLERGLVSVSVRIGDVPVPLPPLRDPATIPLSVLPWLAWDFSVDNWESTWSEADRRAAVAGSLAAHRLKGTPAAIDSVLARLDGHLTVKEWHEQTPAGVPHTFEVTLPLVLDDGTAPGGERSSAAFAERVIVEISRVKPLREHLVLVQEITAGGKIGLQAVARLAGLARLRPEVIVNDTSQPWPLLLQDENGEPLELDDGEFLEHQP